MPPLGKEFAPQPPTETERELLDRLTELETIAAQKAFGLVVTPEGDNLTIPDHYLESKPYLVEGQEDGTHTVAWLVLPMLIRGSRIDLVLTTQTVKNGEKSSYAARQHRHAEFNNGRGEPRTTPFAVGYEKLALSQKVGFMEGLNDTLDKFEMPVIRVPFQESSEATIS